MVSGYKTRRSFWTLIRAFRASLPDGQGLEKLAEGAGLPCWGQCCRYATGCLQKRAGHKSPGQEESPRDAQASVKRGLMIHL